MLQIKLLGVAVLLTVISTLSFAGCQGASCCSKQGGIQFCDSSAGRFVCNNGEYSSCYCTKKAVMDLQAFKGCCMWQGGVFKYDERLGLMICNNGGVSEICSRNPKQDQKVVAW